LFSCKFHNENNSHFTRIIQGEMRMKKLASTRPKNPRLFSQINAKNRLLSEQILLY
jgi:hypothetical protein